MSDCLWGLLDGINDAGLAVSLAFGGRPVLGKGFGVPLIVRYLLETCETVAGAREVLSRLPFHLAHTLTIADRASNVLTVYLSPDREPVFNGFTAATNHQGSVEWPEHAARTRTVERQQCLLSLLAGEAASAEEFVAAFLDPPLHSTGYSHGFGTLYTAAYFPLEGRAEFRWPGATWQQSLLAFREGTHVETLVEASVA
jgi:predicted choloylglycine hydrolase